MVDRCIDPCIVRRRVGFSGFCAAGSTRIILEAFESLHLDPEEANKQDDDHG